MYIIKTKDEEIRCKYWTWFIVDAMLMIGYVICDEGAMNIIEADSDLEIKEVQDEQ